MGLVIQFASEMCEALRLCLAQLLMCNMRLHQFEVLRLMSSACVLFLALGVYSLEWRRFWEAEAWRRLAAHPHWYLAAGALPRCSYTERTRLAKRQPTVGHFCTPTLHVCRRSRPAATVPRTRC